MTTAQACSHALVDPHTPAPAVCTSCKILLHPLHALLIVEIRTAAAAVLVFFLKPIDYFQCCLKHQQWKGRFFWELISLKAWVSTAHGHVVWCLNARVNCNYFIAEHTQLFTFSAFFSGVTSCGGSHIFSLLWTGLSMHCGFSLSPVLLISY